MDLIAYKKVDAFTEIPHKGNPAGVVTEASELSENEMKAIAREVNFSETAFVLPARGDHADLRLRWFTPTNEVPLCGHGTIAAFHALAEENLYGMKGDGTFSFRVETASGILPVEVTKEKGKARVKFGLPLPQFKIPNTSFKINFSGELGIEADAYEKHLSVVIGGGNIFFPIRRLSSLLRMQPRFDMLGKALKQRGLMGVCAFSLETVDPQSSFHSRYFAPNDGINEDPVTGSTNGPLGVYMVQYGVVPVNGETVTMIGEQGDAIGKRGRVTVEVKMVRGRPSSVFIAGSAITFGEEQMKV
jgi:PhzF family phenazine biosynthesis protein